MRKQMAMALGMVSVVALVFGCERLKPIGARGSRAAKSSGTSQPLPEGGKKLSVNMYIMSKCPFGVQAVQGFKPVLDEIGPWIDFKLDYIADQQGETFSSLHGQPEVKGDIQQLCVMKHYPDQGKWNAWLGCVNENWKEIPEGWDKCAEKNGMDVGKLRSCIDGAQGKDLLRQSLQRAKAANAQGSPTIKIAGADYQGGRGKNDFMRALCPKFEGKKPDACAKLPEEKEVVATIITDKRCVKCQTAGLEANLRSRFFSKLKVKTLDYSDPEGKKLYNQLGLKMLPVMLFHQGVEAAERYGQIARWMEPKGDYKMLKIPANFDPTAEICDNKQDDTGNGKVDCDDEDCTNALVCRKEMPKRAEVFIMSQCPYGVQAVDAMKEVLATLKGVEFDVHYIADKTDAGFSSLHGQPEVEENLRQLCAKKYYKRNNKYLDYIWCRNKDYRSNEWKGCATGGIDAGKIEKCATSDEGKKLLEEDLKIAKALEISGSPTWLANNKYKFGGIAAEAIKNNLCQHNAGLAGCDKKLTEKVQAAGSCGN
jgi:hypothetical protein